MACYTSSATFSTYQPFYTPSTSRQLVDYAKFFGLSHLKHTPIPAPPKPRSRPLKPEPPPTYHQPSNPQSSPEPQFTQKNKEPMHQYSSQVLPHLSNQKKPQLMKNLILPPPTLKKASLISLSF